jgi:transposase
VSQLRLEQAVIVRIKPLPLPGKAQLPVPRHVPRSDHVWLTDAEWAFLSPFLLEGRVRSGRPPTDHRRVMNAIFWIARQGLPWRELPPDMGNWNSAFRQYRRWRQHGVWDSLERHLEAIEPDPASSSIQGIDTQHLLALIKLAQAIQTRPKFIPERMGRRRRVHTDDAHEA